MAIHCDGCGVVVDHAIGLPIRRSGDVGEHVRWLISISIRRDSELYGNGAINKQVVACDACLEALVAAFQVAIEEWEKH